MLYNYKDKLSSARLRKSTVNRSTRIDDFYSDRSRILYCSSFRRLQQKAQVFSLEPNASVRTRLTHSLEVSDLGRTLANKIAYKLHAKKYLSAANIPVFVSVVENACLLHDIGNPPFGHFGESAIRDWAKSNAKKCCPNDVEFTGTLKILMNDFYEFDGNPQGFRTITKLHTEHDRHSLNLTTATLLCGLKYSRAAGERKGEGILKKAGYFQSEKQLVQQLYESVGMKLHHRFPLTYIMEAADDIAYCMSDIADGIEKNILTEERFISEFLKEWETRYPKEELPVVVPSYDNMQGFNRDISIPWSKEAMDEALNYYFENHQDVYEGTATELLPKNGRIGRVLDTMKHVSRRILYTSFEAESIELTGYAVIYGILSNYERLLALPSETFISLVNNSSEVKDIDVERRLFNRLGHRYIQAYCYALSDLSSDDIGYKEKEWWLRVHLLIDHVSGMTDEFALQTYQMLTGINVLRN